MDFKKLVVVSNRLPIRFVRENGDEWRPVPASGGLVTALNPVLKERGGKWIGWLGAHDIDNADQLIKDIKAQLGYELIPVELSESEINNYYFGFSNKILWPLFHDMISKGDFQHEFWPVYKSVNAKFAEVIALHSDEDDFVWVQDYHLIYTAKKLKQMGITRKIGFFLHIPFPPPDIFFKLPWRREILDGLLQYDIVGFQSLRDRSNFIQCAKTLIPGTHTQGSGYFGIVKTPLRRVRVGAFPISIDYKGFARDAASEEVTREIERLRELFRDKTIMLGVDRLDYSKGIPHRMRAFSNALQRFPELIGKITFIQVIVPSRITVSAYQDLKDEIDRLIGSINGRFTQPGWTPIVYIFNSIPLNKLLALYREARIALVTPLKDGMNLVAKEYCASSIDNTGCLILSEFAGAASQLSNGAILVNPFDVEGTANAIFRAYTMSEEEQKERMTRLRRSIRRNDINRWVDNFLRSSTGIEPGHIAPFDDPEPRAYSHIPRYEPVEERGENSGGESAHVLKQLLNSEREIKSRKPRKTK